MKRVTDFNFMGPQIDRHLNLIAHIQNIPIKYILPPGVINRLKLYLPTQILRNVIYTIL